MISNSDLAVGLKQILSNISCPSLMTCFIAEFGKDPNEIYGQNYYVNPTKDAQRFRSISTETYPVAPKRNSRKSNRTSSASNIDHFQNLSQSEMQISNKNKRLYPKEKNPFVYERKQISIVCDVTAPNKNNGRFQKRRRAPCPPHINKTSRPGQRIKNYSPNISEICLDRPPLIYRAPNSFCSALKESVPVKHVQVPNHNGCQTPESCCVVCLEPDKMCNSAIVPCGHAKTCFECAEQIFKLGKHCPICRGYIRSVMRIYN